MRLRFPVARTALPVLSAFVAAAAFALPWTLAPVIPPLLVVALAVAVGVGVHAAAVRMSATEVRIDVSATRLRVERTPAAEPPVEIPLAEVVGAHAVDGALVLFHAGLPDRTVIALPGHARDTIRALESVVEDLRERMNERVGTARDVPRELAGLRERE